jgi:hypothetical protein
MLWVDCFRGYELNTGILLISNQNSDLNTLDYIKNTEIVKIFLFILTLLLPGEMQFIQYEAPKLILA